MGEKTPQIEKNTVCASPRERIAGLIIDNRLVVLGVLAAITIGFLVFLKDLRVAGSSEGWVEKNDKRVRTIMEFSEHFGSADAMIIGIETEDTVFRPDVLEQIARVTEKVEKIPNVTEVISLATVRNLVVVDKRPRSLPLMEKVPRTEEEIEALRKAAYNNPLYADNIISSDGKSAGVIAFVFSRTPETSNVSQLNRDFRRVIKQETIPGTKLHLAGLPAMDAEINRLSKEQNRIFVPLVFGLVVVLLLGIFRGLSGVILPAIAIVVSVSWTLGLFTMCGRSIGVMTTALPPLLLVITVAICIHVLTQYREESANFKRRRDVVYHTVVNISRPCFFTALTTAVGFSALLLSDTPIVRELGAFCSIGIVFAFIVSLTLLPSVLTFLPLPSEKVKTSFNAGAFSAALEGVGRFNHRARVPILVAGIAIFAVSFLGIRQIKVETNELEIVEKDNPLRQDFLFVENNLTGIASVEFIVEGSENAISAGTLKSMRKFQDFLEGMEVMRRTISLADFVCLFHRAANGGDDRFYKIPDNDEKIEFYLSVARQQGAKELAPYVTDDYRYARISARMRFVSTTEMDRTMKTINRYLRENMHEDFLVRSTGLVPLFVYMINRIVWGQIRTFTFVVIAVFVMMVVLVRSVKLAAIGMIPNVVPIVLTLGVMGWLKVPLDLATSMIGCTAVGIAVDDTIHYLTRHVREYQRTGNHRDAMFATLRTTGRAITSTSTILFCGFVVLTTSSFVPIRYYGALVSFTMLTALAGDLFLLPACLMVFNPKIPGPKNQT
ncbi:MAG: MMPL family transporter [bacterium]